MSLWLNGLKLKKKKDTLQTSCVHCCRLTRVDAVCLHLYYFQTFVNLSEINCSQPESERNCLETSCIPLSNLCDHHVFESHHPETEGGARSTSGRVGRQMQTFQWDDPASSNFFFPLVLVRLFSYFTLAPINRIIRLLYFPSSDSQFFMAHLVCNSVLTLFQQQHATFSRQALIDPLYTVWPAPNKAKKTQLETSLRKMWNI